MLKWIAKYSFHPDELYFVFRTSVFVLFRIRKKEMHILRVTCIRGRSARKEGRQSILIPIIASLSDCNWVGLEPPTAFIHRHFFCNAGRPKQWRHRGFFRCVRTRRLKAFFLLWHTCSFRANKLLRNEQARELFTAFMYRLDFPFTI